MKKVVLLTSAVLACTFSFGQEMAKASKPASSSNTTVKTPLQQAPSMNVAAMSENEFIQTFFKNGVLPNSFSPYDPNLPLEEKKNIMRSWLKSNPEFKK